jgi:hypothetical protein
MKVVLGPSKVRVGLSICNMIELFNYPNPETGKSDGFQISENPYIKFYVENYANLCPTVPSIKFVRRDIPDDSFNKTLEEQVNRLPKTKCAGFLTLLNRYGFDKFEIGLSKNTEFYTTFGGYRIPKANPHIRAPEACFMAPEFSNVTLTPILQTLAFSLCPNHCIAWRAQGRAEFIGAVPCITAEVKEDTEESVEPPFKKQRVENG